MKSTDFGAFFEKIHGRRPFPWQTRLARLVCESGEWPSIIDLPTGSGKTATLDIAVFHFLVAACAGRPSDASRRVAFVVDRRIIVDEAAVRARRIASAIEEATDGILLEAGKILESSTRERRIEVMTLRGGVARETNLVRDPLRASIVLSTVDQMGSRLLFRGYGVTDYAKPMHAGLFGYDTLLLLDEAHIAEPFRKTLASVQRELRKRVSSLRVRPLVWSQLSATPTGQSDFRLDDEDRRDPVLSRRLEARKPMCLLEVARREDLTKKLVELVRSELREPRLSTSEFPRIGVVVNRVTTAREVHSALVHSIKETADVHLLIGRARPLDRDRLMRRIGASILSSQAPRHGERPIIVVATQTIEVGADLDFHSLFVEAASYPALRQRVGRMNRLGNRDEARGAVVFVAKEADMDAVYGKTIASTWSLLARSANEGVIDLGISRAPAATPETTPVASATPELSPSLLNLLAQTSPRPAVEPDVAQFLHGFEERAPDVSVVWRAGIVGVDGKAIDEAIAREMLEALPPLSPEVMSLPLSGVRAWRAARGSAKSAKHSDSGDLEGDFETLLPSADVPVEVLLVGNDDVQLVPLNRVFPGAMIVVPSEWGGADEYGFAPGSAVPVPDLSIAARRETRRSATVVLLPEIVRTWIRPDAPPEVADAAIDESRSLIRAVEEDDFTTSELRGLLTAWIDAHRGAVDPVVRDTLTDLVADPFDIEALAGGDRVVRGIVLRARRPRPADLADVDVRLQRTVEVPLREHCMGVGEYAERFARGLGLPAGLVADLQLAGRLHDLGKADPRFQAMLGGDGTQLLAKGAGATFERRVVLGARHECYSVALIDRERALLRSASDPDLVRYLVGTHHGRGRGLHPVVADAGTTFEVDIDGEKYAFDGRADLEDLERGWGDLFGRLQERYGHWGLAYLETVLRLADHRRSEEELERKRA